VPARVIFLQEYASAMQVVRFRYGDVNALTAHEAEPMLGLDVAGPSAGVESERIYSLAQYILSLTKPQCPSLLCPVLQAALRTCSMQMLSRPKIPMRLYREHSLARAMSTVIVSAHTAFSFESQIVHNHLSNPY
jgi:hypothetical protein